MAEDTVVRSILSEKDTRMTGLTFIPYKVWVELKVIPLIVCDTIVKAVDEGGGVGGGEGSLFLLHDKHKSANK